MTLRNTLSLDCFIEEKIFMAYTIKQLAKISGISTRTLRWYDTIELLKPAYHGTNAYRYYEEKQMLIL